MKGMPISTEALPMVCGPNIDSQEDFSRSCNHYPRDFDFANTEEIQESRQLPMGVSMQG